MAAIDPNRTWALLQQPLAAARTYLRPRSAQIYV
jgi:hypothetical protein